MSEIHLQALVAEMKAYAERHPHDIDGPPDPLYGFPLVDSGCHRKVVIEGQTVGITFSRDLIGAGRSMWHLTLGDEAGTTVLEPEITSALVDAFLGQRGVIRLPADQFPVEMRAMQQYVRLIP